jgi:hypothetical protein
VVAGHYFLALNALYTEEINNNELEQY